MADETAPVLTNLEAPLPTPEDLALVREREQARYGNAVERRRKFDAMVRGARVRADLLPREDLARLGFAVADLMFVQILTGRIQPRNAKEAAEVAKLAIDIARREQGEPDQTLVIDGPEARANAMRVLADLAETARRRHAQTSGQPTPDEAEIVEVTALEREPGPLGQSTTRPFVVGTLSASVNTGPVEGPDGR